MTRRIAAAMIGVVLATLIVAALTTTTVSRALAKTNTEAELVRLAVRRQNQSTILPAACERSAQAQVLADGSVVPLGAVSAAELPSSLDANQLSNGRVVAGTANGTTYAAYACLKRARGGEMFVQILTAEASSGLSRVRRGLVAGGVAALALGLVVAFLLARRLGRPLLDVQRVAARVAAGDLSARVADDEPGELGNLARSVNEMAASLERSRALERQFLLSVSHDLRTPLTSIRGYAEALADGTLTDVGRGAEIIGQQATRLERLVRDLLDLGRLEAREFRLLNSAVDLVDVGQQAVAGFQAEADRRGISIAFTPAAPTKAAILGDPDRLGQIAANLVENALKYATAAVQLSAGSDPNGAWLTVTDDGPGIDPADLPHVFDRLFVARREPRRQESSSGLGLAIVRELVGAMGGRVWAEAAPTPAGQPPGQGTRLVIRFPAHGLALAPAMPGHSHAV